MNTNHNKVLFCPPVQHSIIERGTLSMFARFISDSNHTTFLRCNGAFLNCDRDSEANFHRTFDSCLTCMQESDTFGTWTGSVRHDIATNLSPADIERTKRWVAEIPDADLPIATFDGCTPFTWIAKLFNARFDRKEFDPTNRQHELFARRHMLTVIRARLATRRLLFLIKPDFVCAVPHSDIQSMACIEAARDIGLRVIEVSWQPSKRVMVFEDWQQNRKLESDLVIQDIGKIKNDPAHWPVEVTERLVAISQFIGLSVTLSKQAPARFANSR